MSDYDLAAGPVMLKSKAPRDLQRSRKVGISEEFCVGCGTTRHNTGDRVTTHPLDCNVPGAFIRRTRKALK